MTRTFLFGYDDAVPAAPNRVPALVALLLGFALSPAAAASGVPVTLPTGESAARWEHALALGGLVAAPAGRAQTIILSDLGGQWLIRARGADGRWREATVRAPRSEADREGVVWLAKSLLTSSDVGAGWGDLSPPTFVVDAAAPTPEPPVPPRRQMPRLTTSTSTAPATTPTPAVLPAPAMPEVPAAKTPVAAPPSAPVAVVPPPKPARPPRPPRGATPPAPTAGWLTAGGALAVRPGTTASGSIEAAIGVRLLRRLDLGLSADLSPATPLLALSGNRSIAQTDLDLGFGLSLPGRAHPVATLHAGAGLRGFSEGTTEVAQGWTPTIGARLALDLPLRAPVGVSPWADARLDLRPTELRVGSESSRLEPLAVRLGLSFSLRRDLGDSPPPIQAP
ncbi:hypothetical protein LBMAG42_01190 [Deltaproteobacteria bacterium]|nr:hypothetical protein LBMAG42_01190 [Deltaproteobacteria bacterium]